MAAPSPDLRQIDDADPPAVVEQMLRDGAADAVRGAGDERDRSLAARRVRIAPSLLRFDRQIGRAPHSVQEPS